VKGAAILGRSPCSRIWCRRRNCITNRWDGMGYPYGLKGDQIPLMAKGTLRSRIRLTAMTTPRPNQAA